MPDQRAVKPLISRSKKAEQVLDAAKSLFIDQGFGTTSMDAIAAAAGVSKATVYAHYPSKEVLFAATARRECHRVMERISLDHDMVDLPLTSALQSFGRSFFNAVMSDEILALLRMVISEVPRFPDIGPIYYACGPGLMHDNVTEYLRRARAEGQIQALDCEQAASQFLAMLRGDLHLRRLLGVSEQTPDSVDRVIDGAVHTFIACYGAKT